jgi:thiol-disulfide isomerase/thioredoxin
MTALRSLLAIGIVAVFCISLAPAQDKGVVLKLVKYDGLKQEILKHRGKVVVVDFWATNCPPCRKALPEYIKLQKELGDRGLVVITVSVDPAEKLERATEILTKMQCDLTNVLLDEPVDMWTKKFESTTVPFSYVFDRRGKWLRFRGAEYSEPEKYDAAVKGTIAQLVAEK